MPQLLVWHCPHEDKLFRTKEEYQEHVKELAWHRFRERNRERLADKLGFIISKRADHIHTFDDLVEFINEHVQLSHECVVWGDYKNPKDYILEWNGVTVDWYSTVMNGHDVELILDVKVDATLVGDHCWSIMGYWNKILQTLGLDLSYGMNTGLAYPGKFFLLNARAHQTLIDQKSCHKEEQEGLAIMARLNGKRYAEQPFKYKELKNAQGDSLPMPGHEDPFRFRGQKPISVPLGKSARTEVSKPQETA